ncbi:hypothetical protein NitaMp002 (mitochondrion) [Nicotiana tabacum]|uniref:Uncharacterized protein n=1 Tax=Nicotiana tabacum TaxID=4097 RepID=Q5MA63_TOBAC|nr:hypothetical protein NitaMp002 [Nicotiana tabacum]BAD83415.1 hypothetical protein [Nicotiana tabacum]
MRNTCKSRLKDKEGKSKRKESLSRSSSQRSKNSKAKSGLRHSNCMNVNLIYVTGLMIANAHKTNIITFFAGRRKEKTSETKWSEGEGGSTWNWLSVNPKYDIDRGKKISYMPKVHLRPSFQATMT